MKTRLLIALTILGLAALGTAPASAQVDLSPGVARVSLIHGDVSTQRGDSGDWAAAALNAPIVVGDKVSTGDRSRAEVQLDYANILRLSDRSQATIAGLTRTKMQVQLGRGLADVAIFKGTEADVEIDTPNVAIRPALREGIYRIEVTSDGETQVIVRKGNAEISTPQGSTRLEKGQQATIRGTGDETQYKVADATSKDSWDSWNNDRNDLIRNAESRRQTNDYYVGAEDLDAYGRWVSVPDYGMVWSPAVAMGWVPYRSGRWVWEPYWGWTWVSYEPWGWAPYHYGRWFEYGGSWVWWPGPVYGYRPYRPIWAPAYVSFFGFGHGGFGVGVGFGFGSVGWLPIGPCDRYYPWYGRHGSQFNTVNITNVTNITNIYNGHGYRGEGPLHAGVAQSNLRRALTDERFRQAVSTVPSEHFGTGRANPIAAKGDMFREGNVMRGNLPIVPTREGLSVTNRPASAGTLRQGGPERFFTKSQPTAVQPFEHQASQVRTAIQNDGRFSASQSGRPSGSVTGPQARAPQGVTRQGSGPDMHPGAIRSEGPAAPGNAPQIQTPKAGPGPETRPAQQNDGWRRFSDRGAGSAPAQGMPTRPQGESRMNRPPDQHDQPASRPEGGMNQGGRPATPAASPSGTQNHDDGWQRFTPQPRAPESSGRGNDMSGGSSGGESRSMGNSPQERSTPVYSNPQRESRQPEYRNAPREARPPLELRRPIVEPRSGPAPSSNRPSGGGGGGGSRPSSGGGGGNHSGGGGGGGSHGGPSHGSSPHR